VFVNPAIFASALHTCLKTRSGLGVQILNIDIPLAQGKILDAYANDGILSETFVCLPELLCCGWLDWIRDGRKGDERAWFPPKAEERGSRPERSFASQGRNERSGENQPSHPQPLES